MQSWRLKGKEKGFTFTRVDSKLSKISQPNIKISMLL